MRILITGGAGFIGSHVCDALHARGDEVYVVDDLSCGRAERLPDGIDLHIETVLNASRLSALVASIEPELICHFAAQVDVRGSVAYPGNDAQVNVVGTVNVLEAACGVGARVLLSSTGGAIYGEDAPIPSAEDVLPTPSSPYGVAKYCAEQYVGLYNRLFGAEHAVLRFANVYGPRQGSSGEACVISAFCAKAIQGSPLTIYGDGKQTRDYIHVDDCVAAVMAIADYGKAGTWNIGSGSEVNVMELAELVTALTSSSSQMEFAPARIGELSRSSLDWGRASRDLGWRPTTSLTDGVQGVIRWFEAGALDRASL